MALDTWLSIMHLTVPCRKNCLDPICTRTWCWMLISYQICLLTLESLKYICERRSCFGVHRCPIRISFIQKWFVKYMKNHIHPNTCACPNNRAPTVFGHFSERGSDLYLPVFPGSLCIRVQSSLPPDLLDDNEPPKCLSAYIHGYWHHLATLTAYMHSSSYQWDATQTSSCSCLKILMHCIFLSMAVFCCMWLQAMKLYSQVEAHYLHFLVDTWPLISLLSICKIQMTHNQLYQEPPRKCVLWQVPGKAHT